VHAALHDYMFLLDRLYENHNDRFGVDKDKEKSRWAARARTAPLRLFHHRLFRFQTPRHK
jgi:hypothetical protein